MPINALIEEGEAAIGTTSPLFSIVLILDLALNFFQRLMSTTMPSKMLTTAPITALLAAKNMVIASINLLDQLPNIELRRNSSRMLPTTLGRSYVAKHIEGSIQGA